MPVVVLSCLSLLTAWLAAGQLSGSELLINDWMMRWRCRLLDSRGTLTDAPTTLVGIDTQTQALYGRFGAGSWQARSPFVKQLAFFQKQTNVSVLAYDLIFADPLGSSSADGGRVTESGERLGRIVSGMAQIVENPSMLISGALLEDLTRFSGEQGNDWLAHALASYTGGTGKRPILGYYFRGGWAAPQSGRVEMWLPEDVYGKSPDGNEEMGRRIPYLKDVAIPESDVHFTGGAEPWQYEYAVNAVFPSQPLLDYCRLGFLHGLPDPDGIVRRVPLVLGFRYRNAVEMREKKVFVPSFSLLACLLHLGMEPPFHPGQVEVYLGREIVIHVPGGEPRRIPIDSKGQLYLNYDTSLERMNQVNFAELTRGDGGGQGSDRLRSLLAGKLALVGVTSAGLDDGATPLSPRAPLVLVHMTAINNILSGRCPVYVTGWSRAGVVLLVFLFFTLLCCREGTARLAAFSVVFLVLYLGIVFSALLMNVAILPTVLPLLFLFLGAFTSMTYRFFVGERSRRKIRGMFSTMVSDKVLTFLEANPESFSLQGHQAEVTVAFSDIAGFSALSERLSPAKLTEILNLYFTPVSDSILRHGGYLDKYLGDGIMAVWGAPFADSEHALRACESALEQIQLVKELNGRLIREYGLEFRIRTGINSGMVTAGNMGSARKFQYTVMGDPVNFAARLEPVNKNFGTEIILGKNTWERVKDQMVTRQLGRIVVMGKVEMVDIFELVGRPGEVPASILHIHDLYRSALEAFWARDWEKSLRFLEEIRLTGANDGPADFLREQTLHSRENPPSGLWRGEYVRKEKY